ncbi:DgyrCDS10600 [Dimorphilus gyrociliatus]|uniref:DgyrCDS10600 n=1 Tax=Dimorphilus gyrociliatus TaxID=2664684 RepID=A0A7I8W0S6_9ANNE|nr:DgyrCDS10600 [Dimorphilus gyrociliatus]
MNCFYYLIILFQLILIVSSQNPTVEIVKTEPAANKGRVIYAQRDEDVTIWCYVENLRPLTKVRYQKTSKSPTGKVQLIDISENERPKDNTKYAIEKPKDFTWRLRIKSTQTHDSGVYSCYIRISEYKSEFSNVTLIVFSKPTFVDHKTTSDAEYKKDEHVKLQCTTEGDPKPYIEWTRVGNALLPIGRERSENPVLDISRIQPQDRGLYRCRSWNMMGEISRQIAVGVLFPPVIEASYSIVKQTEGYLIELQCLVEVNPSPTTAYWLKEDGEIIARSNGRYAVNTFKGAFGHYTIELVINGVKSTDYGSYSCYVTNVIGTEHQSVTLIRSDVPMPSFKQGKIISSSSMIKSSYFIMIPLFLCTFL